MDADRWGVLCMNAQGLVVFSFSLWVFCLHGGLQLFVGEFAYLMNGGISEDDVAWRDDTNQKMVLRSWLDS